MSLFKGDLNTACVHSDEEVDQVVLPWKVLDFGCEGSRQGSRQFTPVHAGIKTVFFNRERVLSSGT